MGTLGPMTPAGSNVSLPAWVNGTAAHTWSPRLGGGIWYPQGAVVTQAAAISTEFSRPLLVGLRGKRHDTGYRFDLDSWDTYPEEYDYWEDRASHEWIIQTFQAEGNAEFFWSMACPSPSNLSATPSATGSGFRWQKSTYYAAYLQYMIEDVSMTPVQYNALNATYDFFTDATCATVNTTSEAAVGDNWANLRAKRGHPDPYPILWVILGIEPHGDAQENLTGAAYGVIAEDYKTEIRARGGALSTIPLGLHCPQWGGAPAKAGSYWRDVLNNCTTADFSYVDCHHHYRQGAAADQLPRIYPSLVNVDAGLTSPGWDMYWVDQSTWLSDYSAYMFVFEDARATLTDEGETASRWHLGDAEHGLTIASQFEGNDMGAAIHWALWVAEIARFNAEWDAMWLLCEQGFSHSLMHYRDSHPTRTPGFYVYQMAHEFYGFEYLPTHTLSNHQWTPTYSSPTSETGTCDTYDFSSPDVTVRVFRDASNGHVHLFVVNKHTANTASVTGFEAATLVRWDRLSAESLTRNNPTGNHADGACGLAGAQHAGGQAWHAETIYTTEVSAGHTPGQPFTIQPISVNHIEVS